jgi:5-methylcytosine-specific restriction enzyme A
MATRDPLPNVLSVDGSPLTPSRVIRRRQLHEAYGGSRQSGISLLGSYDGIFCFTGESGEAHGYHDEWLPDGCFRYYGEGGSGDMEMNRGNQAIHDQPDNGRRIFLFDMNVPERSAVRFVGEFRSVRTGEDRGPDNSGADRRRFFFDLAPIDLETEVAPDTPVTTDNQTVFDEGREREIRTNRVERNRKLVERAKEIHGLSCQVCGFNFEEAYGAHGEGFIEVHHKVPVAAAAKGGGGKVDAKEDMAVLCSNCHRMVHRGGRLLMLDELREIERSASGG